MLFQNTYEKFLKKAQDTLIVKQEQFINQFDINSYSDWYYDQPSGVFTLSKNGEELFFKYQSIGSYSESSGTWQWAWANNYTYPDVKSDSFKIKEYGIKRKFKKLTTTLWDADEITGWEMLSFADHILKPIGVYRVVSDGLFSFFIFTELLTKQEAEHLKENSIEYISCNTHGFRRAAYVCNHLLSFEKTGFHESFETHEGMYLEKGDDLQAWCDKCERIRIKYDGWNEASEEHISIKLICEDCYFNIKKINTL